MNEADIKFLLEETLLGEWLGNNPIWIVLPQNIGDYYSILEKVYDAGCEDTADSMGYDD